MSDDIILQRYVEIDGQLRRILMIVKMRGSGHSKDIREYEVTQDGLGAEQHGDVSFNL